VVTCTGLAAITLILATLPAGARVMALSIVMAAPTGCCGAREKGQLDRRFHRPERCRRTRAALGRKPALVWIETPSNPCCASWISAPSRTPRMRRAPGGADNTFLSPVWQQPLALGADLVMHSTTKYLNGHSDVVGGAVIAATTELTQNLAWWANAIGVTGAPFDSFMTLRGVRTLHARTRCMRRIPWPS